MTQFTYTTLPAKIKGKVFTGTFTGTIFNGDTLTGGTSGATAKVLTILGSGASRTIVVNKIVPNATTGALFTAGETVTCSGTGTGSAAVSANTTVTSGSPTGASGSYQITFATVVSGIKKGYFVSGTGISASLPLPQVSSVQYGATTTTVNVTVANTGTVSGTITFTGTQTAFDIVRTWNGVERWRMAGTRMLREVILAIENLYGSARVTDWGGIPTFGALALPAAASYGPGQAAKTMTFTLTASEPVQVGGYPYLALTLQAAGGGNAVAQAQYNSVTSTSTSLKFDYTPVTADNNGVLVTVPTSLNFPGNSFIGDIVGGTSRKVTPSFTVGALTGILVAD